MATESSSINSFRDQSFVTVFASGAANNAIKFDAVSVQVGSLQAQLNNSLIEQIKMMALLAENEDARSLLAVARKITQVTPENPATHSSGLFSTSLRHSAVPANEEKTNNNFTAG